jgi:hypothetical protein
MSAGRKRLAILAAKEEALALFAMVDHFGF